MKWEEGAFCVGHLAVFPALSSPHPLYFPLFINVMGVSLFGGVGAYGLSGLASHLRSLHLGVGCLYWNLNDVSDTQPPLSDAVVKWYL